MGKVLYAPLRLTRRVNVSAVVSIYKHLTLYSLNYPRRGCRFLQPGPSGFVFLSRHFSLNTKKIWPNFGFSHIGAERNRAHAVSFHSSTLPDAWPGLADHPGTWPSRGTVVTHGLVWHLLADGLQSTHNMRGGGLAIHGSLGQGRPLVGGARIPCRQTGVGRPAHSTQRNRNIFF